MSKEAKLDLIKKKYPKPNKVTANLMKKAKKQQKSFDKITEEQIIKTISQLRNHKSPGPSGIGPRHLKYVTRSHPILVKKLCIIFNALLNTPKLITHVQKLFEFRSVFIPKKNNDFRPIAIQETILLVFHKILTE